MSPPQLTEEDEGKYLVTREGTELGEIMEIREGTPYVDPNPDLVDQVKTKFDWGESDEDAYPLETIDVAEITDNEVHLR